METQREREKERDRANEVQEKEKQNATVEEIELCVRSSCQLFIFTYLLCLSFCLCHSNKLKSTFSICSIH